MPIGIDKKLSVNVALNIIELQKSLLKLEKENNFYIDCGDWEMWRDAIQCARKYGKDKKFLVFTQAEEEMAHEEKAMCLGFGIGKENTSLDEIRIVGKQVYAFLDSEGFEMGWDEDPDSYITIGLDKDLQNAKDPFHLVLEIHVPDEDAIKEKVKNLGFYTAPNSFNKCLNLALPFKDGESVWDVLKRNVFDWKDILRYSIYLENEEDQIDIMPTWNFYADWLENYLELSENKPIQQIPDSEEVTRIIKILYLNKKINEATLQCFTIVAEGLKSKELLEDKEEFFDDISSVDSFKNQIRRGLTPLEEETEVWEVIAQRFKIGKSMQYSNLKEFLDDLNYETMLKVFNGSIKEKFTKMKPVSVNAFFIHLKAYESEICRLFHEKRVSSATYSSISIFLNDSDPEASGDSETFLEEEFFNLYDWVSTDEGILDYLETRYHEAVDDPLEDDDETWLFYIGNTFRCPYKSFEEFKSELDIKMISNIFKKCWDRSCENEYPQGRQLLKDFPEYKIDYSKNKKLKGDELLKKIEEDILPNYEKIKSYGYISTNKNGDEIAVIDEFLQAHTKALENKKNRGHDIPYYEFPGEWKIGKLPRGKYLIGDFAEVLRIADKKLVNECKLFENQSNVPDDEYFFTPNAFEEFLKKEKGIDPTNHIYKLSPDRQFITIGLGVDESSFSDDNGGRYFQSSNCIICIKIDDHYVNREVNMNSYVFEENFECSYFEDYDILKLGEFHVYSDY